jgi:hypothetical protein
MFISASLRVSGKSIEKFLFIFNGAGGNGKGLLDEFLSCSVTTFMKVL